MKRLLSITFIFLLVFTTTVASKSLTLKHANGAKVKVKCTTAACVSMHYTSDGVKGKPVKAVGGSIGYFELKNKWNAKGYK